jgi:hypothetical protein
MCAFALAVLSDHENRSPYSVHCTHSLSIFRAGNTSSSTAISIWIFDSLIGCITANVLCLEVCKRHGEWRLQCSYSFHESRFCNFDEIEIPTKFYPNFAEISIIRFSEILISMSKSEFRFRWQNRNFDFDCLLPTKSKFRWNSVQVSPNFRSQTRNFDFGFDVAIGISILVSISPSKFRLFIFEIGISIPTSEFWCYYKISIQMSKFQSIFH